MPYSKLIEVVKEALKDRGECHGFNHAIDVMKWSSLIAEGLEVDHKLMSAIALIHDVFDHKFIAKASEQWRCNTVVALDECLKSMALDEGDFKIIHSEIDLISYSKGGVPETLEGRIVQDADRICGLGAIGVMRCIAYNVTHGMSFDDAVEHMRDKLIKLHGKLNTERAKTLSLSSHNFILDFINRHEFERKLLQVFS